MLQSYCPSKKVRSCFEQATVFCSVLSITFCVYYGFLFDCPGVNLSFNFSSNRVFYFCVPCLYQRCFLFFAYLLFVFIFFNLLLTCLYPFVLCLVGSRRSSLNGFISGRGLCNLTALRKVDDVVDFFKCLCINFASRSFIVCWLNITTYIHVYIIYFFRYHVVVGQDVACCNTETFKQIWPRVVDVYKCKYIYIHIKKSVMENTSKLSLEQIKERMALYQGLQDRKRWRNRPYFYGKKPRIGKTNICKKKRTVRNRTQKIGCKSYPWLPWLTPCSSNFWVLVVIIHCHYFLMLKIFFRVCGVWVALPLRHKLPELQEFVGHG